MAPNESNVGETSVLISNMHPNVGAELLEDRLNIYGDIKNVNFIRGEKGSTGMAYVEFYKGENAQQAINEMNEKYFFGQLVNVKLASQEMLDTSMNPTTISNNPKNNVKSQNTSKNIKLKRKSIHYIDKHNISLKKPNKDELLKKSPNTNLTIEINAFEDNESRTAIIENLSPTVTASVLINHLQKVGNIISCGFYDIVSLRKRKTAYITFSTVLECLNFISKFHKQFFIDEAIIVSLQPDSEILKFLFDKFNLKGSDDITSEFIEGLSSNRVVNIPTIQTYMTTATCLPSQNQNTVIFRVGNIPPESTNEQLEEHFLYTGQILNIQPSHNIDTNNATTNDDVNDQEVLVTFTKSDSVMFIERLMNNSRFKGRLLQVEMLT